MTRKMFLIVKLDGKKYWTEKYLESDGFLVFETSGGQGKIIPYRVSLKVVAEISQHDVDDKKIK
jgi:hypothetical protein